MTVLGGFWKKFVDLLPKAPRYTGIILSVDSPGRYTVQLTGSGIVQVIGNTGYSVNDRVFVADKKIESKAPTLTAVNIEV